MRESLAKRMLEYEGAIRLAHHDKNAGEGAETLLLKVCQAHTNRYLQTFQRAALPAKLRVDCKVAPVPSAGSAWEAVKGEAGNASSVSLLDVALTHNTDDAVE